MPNGFFAVDEARCFICIEKDIDDTTPEEEAREILNYLRHAHRSYYPKSFWDDQPYYIQMLVEKIDLRSLFEPICRKYNIPIATAKGWSAIGQRKEIANRFRWHEDEGRIPVLLYCGDFDPAGLQISNFIKSNLDDIYGATGWNTDNLIVDRFGLDYDFIIGNNLTWIDNLVTGLDSKKGTNDLSNPKHPDHYKEYVQNYLKQYGARKVEANAIVIVPEIGRALCEATINKYIPAYSVDEHRRYIATQQNEVMRHVQQFIKGLKEM